MDRRLASSKSRETQQLPPWASQDVTVSSRIEEDRNEPIGVTLGNAYLNGSQSPSRTVIRRHLDSTGSLFWRLAVAASAIARGLCFHLPQVQHRPAAWVSNLVDVVCRDLCAVLFRCRMSYCLFPISVNFENHQYLCCFFVLLR